MELVLNEETKAVLEFMQANIPSSKLLGVADSIPNVARLLWSGYPQEPLKILQLTGTPITHGLPQDATGFGPELGCAGDDSAGVGDFQ